MVYELYVDSIFLVNFVMNLYLLILVNKSLMRTATRKRLILGAGVGAVIYLSVFLVNVTWYVKCPIAFLLGTVCMVKVTFRISEFRGFLKILKGLFQYSFLLGGLLLFLGSVFPFVGRMLTKVSGVLLVGTLGFLWVDFCKQRERKHGRLSMCDVKLTTQTGCLTRRALVDSGNSLTEPVSGKPVSIIDRQTFRTLWGEEALPYRVIPYHSIGRKRGILQGYLLPMLEVEIEGIKKSFSNVYVAVCEEEHMDCVILNPKLFEEKSHTLRETQKRREKEDDFKGGNAGQTAV